MAKVVQETGADFVLGLGDNFYEFGVKTADDVRFKDSFETIYHQSELQNRWYMIAGNHDHYGNVNAELEYAKVVFDMLFLTSQTSPRWYMPSLYYTETLTIPNTSKKAQFFFIDTIILAGLTHDGEMTQPQRTQVEFAI